MIDTFYMFYSFLTRISKKILYFKLEFQLTSFALAKIDFSTFYLIGFNLVWV